MKKILLIRFSSIGDIVLTTPVIRALKQQLNCELHVLTRKTFETITLNNPNVDKVHAIENKLSEVIGQLRDEEFDFIVDLQINARSLKVRKALNKPVSSFPKLNIQKWLLVNFKLNYLPGKHIVDRYFEAVKPLGVNNDGKGLEYFIPGGENVDLKTLPSEFQNGFIGFVIGGRHNTKMLPPEKVIAVIEKLKLPVILLGGKENREEGNLILKSSAEGKVFNACGEFSLNQSASLVKQSRVIITNDTGLMHIAAAFQKPIISIWGNTIPQFGMYPYFPENEAESFFAELKDLNCRPCSKLGFKKCPKKHFRCMMDQDVELIANKASELINAII